MNVLLLAVAPVRKDLTSGNTFSNLFESINRIEQIEFSNIFMKTGEPDNNFISSYFQITPKMVIKNLLNPKNPAGRRLEKKNAEEELPEKQQAIYDKMRLMRLQIFFWARDLIWAPGNWKSEELKQYLDEVKPDLIFAPIYDKTYGNRMALFVQEYTKKPMIGYIWDDVYSLKQFSLSPLYWADRFIKRHYIRKAAARCSFLYVISEKQQKEYSISLKKECRLLYKGYDFKGEATPKPKPGQPLQLLYMGNIAFGRWKVLARIAKALQQINADGIKAQLSVYTLSPKSGEMIRKLNLPGTSKIMDVVPSNEVERIQKSADILVHVEPVSLKEQLIYRLSFSTKIVDYFRASRCIFACGKGSATIEYLKDHDAAIVVENIGDIEEQLRALIQNPDRIREYSVKGWNCGKSNHQLREIQGRLVKDFNEVVDGQKKAGRN